MLETLSLDGAGIVSTGRALSRRGGHCLDRVGIVSIGQILPQSSCAKEVTMRRECEQRVWLDIACRQKDN